MLDGGFCNVSMEDMDYVGHSHGVEVYMDTTGKERLDFEPQKKEWIRFNKTSLYKLKGCAVESLCVQRLTGRQGDTENKTGDMSRPQMVKSIIQWMETGDMAAASTFLKITIDDKKRAQQSMPRNVCRGQQMEKTQPSAGTAWNKATAKPLRVGKVNRLQPEQATEARGSLKQSGLRWCS